MPPAAVGRVLWIQQYPGSKEYVVRAQNDLDSLLTPAAWSAAVEANAACSAALVRTGHPVEILSDPASISELEPSFSTGAFMRIRLLNAKDSSPVAAKLVRIGGPGIYEPTTGWLNSAVSDAAGEASMPFPLGMGLWRVDVDGYPGRQDRWVRIDAAMLGGTLEHVMILDRDAHIAGRCVSAEGRALPGLRVRASTPAGTVSDVAAPIGDAWTLTEIDGSFLLPGSRSGSPLVDLIVHLPWASDTRILGQAIPWGTDIGTAVIALPRQPSVTVRVRRSDGAIVRRFGVALASSNSGYQVPGGPRHVGLHESGSLELVFADCRPDEEIGIQAVPLDPGLLPGPWVRSTPRQLAKNGIVDLEVVVGRNVTVYVTDGAGAPVGDAHVALGVPAESESPTTKEVPYGSYFAGPANRLVVARGTSSATGRCDLYAPDYIAECLVMANAAGFVSVKERFRIGATPKPVVVLVLERGVILELHGQPRLNGDLSVDVTWGEFELGHRRHAAFDEVGIARLRDVPSGSATLDVRFREVSLPEFSREIQIEDSAVTRLSIVSPGQDIVAPCSVSLRFEDQVPDGGWLSVCRTTDGVVEDRHLGMLRCEWSREEIATSLPTGDYRAFLSSSDGILYVSTATYRLESDVSRLEFAMVPCYVHLRLVSDDGSPLPNHSLVLATTDRQFSMSVSTDGRGEVHITRSAPFMTYEIRTGGRVIRSMEPQHNNQIIDVHLR
ncbi:MAG: hypothetical protein AB7N24_23685 [Dehalococcoidia bacterium]